MNDYFTEFKTHWKKVPLKNFVMGEYGFDEGIDTAVDISKKDGTPSPAGIAKESSSTSGRKMASG